MTPDEQAFKEDLQAPPFLSGELRGRWRTIRIQWPVVIFGITARDGLEYVFRFDCHNYPVSAPTARPWSNERDAPASELEWPRGSGRVAAVFRLDWKSGSALYLPCDRVSIDGHPNWRSEYASMLWDPELGIVHYLEIVHELLSSRDYSPKASAA